MSSPESFMQLLALGADEAAEQLIKTLEYAAETGTAISMSSFISVTRTAELVLHKSVMEQLLVSARKGALKQWQKGQHAEQREYDDLAHFLEDGLEALEKVNRLGAAAVAGAVGA